MAFLYVNGRRLELPNGRAECTLLQWLREQGYTGTKLGCGEGGCGACTVMISRKQATESSPSHMAVNACLCPLYSVAGCHVVTVEGIGNNREGLHPVQERLAKAHGSQCGFCTPGFVMSMYSLLRSTPEPPTMHTIEDALAGNLCRCTGYRPIMDAFSAFADVDPRIYSDDSIAARPPGVYKGKANGGMTCPSSGLPCDCKAQKDNACVSEGAKVACSANGKSSCCAAGDWGAAAKEMSKFGSIHPGKRSCEPIFPPELFKFTPEEWTCPGEIATWRRCVTMQSLLALKAETPTAKLVGGNTEVGIEMRIKRCDYPLLVDASFIPEMQLLTSTATGLEVGGAVTLTQLLVACRDAISARGPDTTQTMRAVVGQLRWFAGVQIRNVATLAGNIVTGSPISDLNPIWVATGTTFVLQSAAGGERVVPASKFFLGYRKVEMEHDEVLTKVVIPWSEPLEFVKEYKQAHRRDDDIALVNAAMRMKLRNDGDQKVIEAVDIVYGGVGPTVVVAKNAMQCLVGKPFGESLVKEAMKRVQEDVNVAETAPGGMGAYRTALAQSFLFKFMVWVAKELPGASKEGWPAVEDASAIAEYDRPPAKGVQFYYEGKVGEIGHPLQHAAAELQVCGDAKYTDDVPLPENTLHAALVTSTVAHAKLINVDPTEALKVSGVVAYYGAADVPGKNTIGPVFPDELVFAVDKVTCVGNVIGIVVAETQDLAKFGVAAMKIDYEELPAIISIEDAIAANQIYPEYTTVHKHGDVDAAFSAPNVAGTVEGVARMGGQEHFYLEPNTCYVQPIENDEFLLVSSTQDLTKHQQAVSKVLDVPMHKLVSKTKRLGGGFGGKETRGVFTHCCAAVASFHTRRPVRLVLDRQQDMQITGQRHAFLGKYKVAYDAEGRILALDLDLYSNAGNSIDLSHAVMDRAIAHSDGSFYIPAACIRGHLARTNQPSHTAFRGFGGPQGMMICAIWMEHISRVTGIPMPELQAKNLYAEGDKTHYGQVLTHCRLQRCWDEVIEMAELEKQRAAVDAFNATSRYRKRGIAVLPTKFGISFTFVPMNQAGALVMIYMDGSIGLAHGGVEMGQGLHTKMCQVAANALGVSPSVVHVAETSTDKVPNASPTAASASSDLYGAAILNACAQLEDRLKPIREKLGPDATMPEIASAAWFDRVDLCAHGFYITPDVTGTDGGMPFDYFVYGAAVSIVELDCLTGDWHNLRTDIAMDIGNPINPAIDIGQVEGGFIQGMGWSCLEELKWGDAEHPWIKPGVLLTQGPGNYKIPTANDIPVDFRVRLLENAPNTRAVHSSKAVGEPPLHLGSTVFFALKDAVYNARKHAGLHNHFVLDLPATPERLRMACVDEYTASTCADADYVPPLSC